MYSMNSERSLIIFSQSAINNGDPDVSPSSKTRCTLKSSETEWRYLKLHNERASEVEKWQSA